MQMILKSLYFTFDYSLVCMYVCMLLPTDNIKVTVTLLHNKKLSLNGLYVKISANLLVHYNQPDLLGPLRRNVPTAPSVRSKISEESFSWTKAGTNHQGSVAPTGLTPGLKLSRS